MYRLFVLTCPRIIIERQNETSVASVSLALVEFSLGLSERIKDSL